MSDEKVERWTISLCSQCGVECQDDRDYGMSPMGGCGDPERRCGVYTQATSRFVGPVNHPPGFTDVEVVPASALARVEEELEAARELCNRKDARWVDEAMRAEKAEAERDRAEAAREEAFNQTVDARAERDEARGRCEALIFQINSRPELAAESRLEAVREWAGHGTTATSERDWSGSRRLRKRSSPSSIRRRGRMENDGGNRMKMRDRKLTRRQGLVAYWLPLTLIVALLGILLALWLGTPKAGASQVACKTARASRAIKGGPFSKTLYWGNISFLFCTSTRTGEIVSMPAPHLHWGLGDFGRLSGWHADGRCGGSGPRFTDKKHHYGTLTRALCYGQIGGKVRQIVFTIQFNGYKGFGPNFAVFVSPPA